MYKVIKVISGGQTGADIGGVMATHDLFIETGGAMPRNFMTENGPRPRAEIDKYKFIELDSPEYPPRTRKNIVDSDCTFVFGEISGGSKLTVTLCMSERRPCLSLDSSREFNKAYKFLSMMGNLQHALITPERKQLIVSRDGLIINVTGNRESKSPGNAEFTYEFMKSLLIKFNQLDN